MPEGVVGARVVGALPPEGCLAPPPEGSTGAGAGAGTGAGGAAGVGTVPTPEGTAPPPAALPMGTAPPPEGAAPILFERDRDRCCVSRGAWPLNVTSSPKGSKKSLPAGTVSLPASSVPSGVACEIGASVELIAHNAHDENGVFFVLKNTHNFKTFEPK